MDVYKGDRAVIEAIIANTKKAKAQPAGNQHAWEENTALLSSEKIGPEWMHIEPVERCALQIQMARDQAAEKTPSNLNGTMAYFHSEIRSEASAFLEWVEKRDIRMVDLDVCFRYVLYTILAYLMKGSGGEVCQKFDEGINHVEAWFSQIVTSSGKNISSMTAEQLESKMANEGKSAEKWKCRIPLACKAFRRMQGLNFAPLLILRMSNVIVDMMFAAFGMKPLTGAEVTLFCEVAAICKWKLMSNVTGVTPQVKEVLVQFPWGSFDQGSPSLDGPSYRFHIATCGQYIKGFTDEVRASIHTVFEEKALSVRK